MADAKITALTALTAPTGTCVLPIVDPADTTDAPSGTTKQITLANLLQSRPVPNLAHNGGAEVWQRGTSLSGLADGGYCADRFYVLYQTNTIAAAQAAGTLGARYALQLTQSQASAQRMGVAQVVEASDAIPYRGRAVRFQVTVKASTNTNVRLAIVEWTGTADAVTRDVVNDWTSSTYTAGNFFTSTTTTVTAVSASNGATTSYQTFSVSGTVSASCNNLVVLVWTEGTAAQNVTLSVTEVGLYDGNAAQVWLPRPLAVELALCQRFFLAFSGQPLAITLNSSALYNLFIPWTQEMRAGPTLVSGTYAVGTGSAGTVQLTTSTTKGGRFDNSAANWTTGTSVTLTAQLTAEL